ncbi:DUF4270 family protein [Sphingobacterium corticibacterium]|uniref:DUF4270 family protein n=2 Tax=Sphingobacterium corticibacterium TaxID=2484746 RepID=A0A4V2DCI4_9SPHI|nr:DUF4270 family protein [Sphingobacterium corticibacterium]
MLPYLACHLLHLFFKTKQKVYHVIFLLFDLTIFNPVKPLLTLNIHSFVADMNQQNMNGFRAVYHYCVWIIVLQFLSACSGDGLDVGIVNELAGVNRADTLTVEASTFLLDPLPTTGQGVLLVGRIDDADLGRVESRSYFRLSNEQLALSSLPENSRYDSLSITLYYNGYSYGDTTKLTRFNLHRVIEDIEPYEFPIALEDDEYPVFASGGTTLLANREFAYDSESLGSVSFRPRPNTPEDTVVTIRLDDQWGQTLFDMAVNEDTRLTVNDDFVNFLKGMVLVPADESEGVVIGFKDSVALEIHYSYETQNDGMREEGVISFPIGATTHQFNRIIIDRAGTPLADLSDQNDNLASSLTGNRTYLQGLTGVVTRLRFPSARLFVNDGAIAITKAQLIIETDQSKEHVFSPPDALILMQANRYGTPVSILPNSFQSDTQTAYYQMGSQSGGAANGKYVFDLTGYMNGLRNSVEDEAVSLLLALPTTSLLSAVDHLKIAVKDVRPAIKLQVLYVKF